MDTLLFLKYNKKMCHEMDVFNVLYSVTLSWRKG